MVTPVWPNLTAQPQILGAQLRTLSLEPSKGRWVLPLEKLLNSITANTRLLVLNSPNNPTGWTLNRQEQQAILDKCRSTGTWILADEVYESLFSWTAKTIAHPVFGYCATGRQTGGGTQLFQKLFNDRLALGVVGHAARDDAAHGQID